MIVYDVIIVDHMLVHTSLQSLVAIPLAPSTSSSTLAMNSLSMWVKLWYLATLSIEGQISTWCDGTLYSSSTLITHTWKHFS